MRGAERTLLPLLLVAAFGLRLWAAQLEPDPRHAYDERFSVRNVAWILHTARPWPENGFHPSLSYLPHLAPLAVSEVLFRWTGRPGFQVLAKGPGNEIGRSGKADGLRLTPLGYRLARGVNCLVGTLSIWLCFLVGRRLFGPGVGLWAAFLLACVPWHLRQSAVFKPDIVVVAAVLLAFYWALRAARSERAADWALAGAGVGLSLAAKFNAVPAAIPLTLAALWRLPRDRRVVVRLVLAGAAAVVAFLLLNPAVLVDFGMYEFDFGATLRDYARKGRMADATRYEAAAAALGWLLDPIFHGRVIGLLALAGAAGLGVSWLRRREDRLERLLLLAFPAGYAAIYILITQNPGGWHNWLVLAPFTSLYAAWGAAAIGRAIGSRLPGRVRAPSGLAAALALVAVAGGPAVLYAYRAAVPLTWTVARDELRQILRNQAGRIVYQEVVVPAPLAFARGRAVRPGVFQEEALSRVDEGRLDVADVEIFDGASLAGETASFYRRRLDRLGPDHVLRIPSGGLRGRGPEIWIVAHPLAPAGPPLPVTLERRERRRPLFAGRVAPRRGPGRGRRLISFGFWLPNAPAGADAGPRLEVDGAALAVAPALTSGAATFYLSDRLPEPAGGPRVVLRPEADPGAESQGVIVYFWRPPPT